MLNYIRHDPVFALITIIGIFVGYKSFTGELHAHAAWNTYKSAHACKAISSVAWRCDDGKTYYPRAEWLSE